MLKPERVQSPRMILESRLASIKDDYHQNGNQSLHPFLTDAKLESEFYRHLNITVPRDFPFRNQQAKQIEAECRLWNYLWRNSRPIEDVSTLVSTSQDVPIPLPHPFVAIHSPSFSSSPSLLPTSKVQSPTAKPRSKITWIIDNHFFASPRQSPPYSPENDFDGFEDLTAKEYSDGFHQAVMEQKNDPKWSPSLGWDSNTGQPRFSLMIDVRPYDILITAENGKYLDELNSMLSPTFKLECIHSHNNAHLRSLIWLELLDQPSGRKNHVPKRVHKAATHIMTVFKSWLKFRDHDGRLPVITEWYAQFLQLTPANRAAVTVDYKRPATPIDGLSKTEWDRLGCGDEDRVPF
ncbi:uncharacterized protein LY89DRAFT_743753 [Mollisia scopiformis]|uniref:Uncharacterized protein n=1 Tax=Mollisia scopiformis TaxID=149040 RepID=A0A132B2K9_MOLSC|nr:uncharacterized protein LY89DRAFT_743753 [Mollisia scopiformis]KUJ06626.1 hypothetical protein LY89DRAFT_743753 [Mollisia scopiformis]